MGSYGYHELVSGLDPVVSSEIVVAGETVKIDTYAVQKFSFYSYDPADDLGFGDAVEFTRKSRHKPFTYHGGKGERYVSWLYDEMFDSMDDDGCGGEPRRVDNKRYISVLAKLDDPSAWFTRCSGRFDEDLGDFGGDAIILFRVSSEEAELEFPGESDESKYEKLLSASKNVANRYMAWRRGDVYEVVVMVDGEARDVHGTFYGDVEYGEAKLESVERHEEVCARIASEIEEEESQQLERLVRRWPETAEKMLAELKRITVW